MKRIRKVFYISILTMLIAMIFTLGAFAEDPKYIPENDPNTAQVTESQDKQVQSKVSDNFDAKSNSTTDKNTKLAEGVGEKSVANGLFHADKFGASTEQSEAAGAWISGNTRILLSIVVSIFPSIIILQVIIDTLCFLIFPLGMLLSRLKFPIYSRECAEVAGLPYEFGKKSDSPATPEGDKDKKGKYGHYILTRFFISLFCGVMITMCATGAMVDLINLVAGLCGWLQDKVTQAC